MKLNQINIRDPFILPYEGKYYLYGSRVGVPSEEKYWGDQTGFDVYISEDLENWSEPKSIFEISPDFWGEKDAWAPEVHYYKDKFYLFGSFLAEGRQRGTHILVCDTPDGTFRPLSKDPATPLDWECLDGTFYVDKKGTPYMVFCHEWVQIGNGTVCAVRLSEDLSAPIGEPVQLWKATDYKDCYGGRNKDRFVTDGPFLFREGEDLYAIWSSFNADGYVELLCKSDNGEIDGSWSVLDRPLSAENGGHGMIFTALDGKDYFVMHRPNKPPTAERPVLFPLHRKDGEFYV